MIKKEITNFLYKTSKIYNSDICGFGKDVKAKFFTWQEWTAFNLFDKYADSIFNVEVDVKMRRPGLILKSIQ